MAQQAIVDFCPRIDDHGGGHGHAAVNHGPAGGTQARAHFGTGADHQVAAEQQAGAAEGHPGAVDVVRLGRQTHVGDHAAAALGQAGEVHHRDAAAVDVGSHADDLARGDDARTADAGDQDAVGLRDLGAGRGRQRSGEIGAGCSRRQAPRLGTFQGDQGGTEAFETGKITIASRLVDGPLASQGRFEGHH